MVYKLGWEKSRGVSTDFSDWNNITDDRWRISHEKLKYHQAQK